MEFRISVHNRSRGTAHPLRLIDSKRTDADNAFVACIFPLDGTGRRFIGLGRTPSEAAAHGVTKWQEA